MQSSGGPRRPARDQARGQQQLQQMVRILVHGETVEGDEGKRMALQGPVEQAQMYAVCMQELSLLVSSHSPTLADLCGTLWHGFVGLFRKSLAGEEAQLDVEYLLALAPNSSARFYSMADRNPCGREPRAARAARRREASARL